MIIITKDEAMALREKYGDEAHITITSRHKKGGRKKYYAAEERRNIVFIERYRSKQTRQHQGAIGAQFDIGSRIEPRNTNKKAHDGRHHNRSKS